jgi:hypothetical protein
LPAGDRTHLVLAKPNVIMNVEGDGAQPGAAAQQAAQLQQPFGEDTGALLLHHFGSRSGSGRH